jgi:hypothetical protein
VGGAGRVGVDGAVGLGADVLVQASKERMSKIEQTFKYFMARPPS